MEIKLTYIVDAMQKLKSLYIPVVEMAHTVRAAPLVLVRNVTPFAPAPSWSLRDALQTPYPLVHWAGGKHMVLE